MSKTMKQIADEIQVSKQAVWQRIKRNAELSAMFESHSETVNGRIYVDEFFEQHVKKLYPNRKHVDDVDGCLRCVDINKPDVDVNVDINMPGVDVNVDGNIYDSSTCVDEKHSHVDDSSTHVDSNSVYVDDNVDGSLHRVDVNRSDIDVNTLIATLQSTVNTLKHQLTVKDNQITELTSMLKASQEQQATLVAALSAAQALHAGTIQERLTDRFEDSEAKEDSVVDTSGDKKKKKNFFAKIFRRN